ITASSLVVVVKRLILCNTSLSRPTRTQSTVSVFLPRLTAKLSLFMLVVDGGFFAGCSCKKANFV
ncbi:MAG: hypothetical protein IJD83_09560, partial [Clostridia bacterium]|nr:hypothetical protein [Clostridia bacterium]